jgi:hypothetical protein
MSWGSNMFFKKQKSLKEIKDAIRELKGAIHLSNEMIIEICQLDKQYRITKKDYEHAIKLGCYLLACVSTVNIFGIIKNESIRNEVLRFFFESLLDLDSVEKFGFEKSTHHIVASMYKIMYDRCNVPCAGDALEFFADVCADFISNELRMNYSTEQIKFLSTLINNCNKKIYGEVVAECMNLNL